MTMLFFLICWTTASFATLPEPVHSQFEAEKQRYATLNNSQHPIDPFGHDVSANDFFITHQQRLAAIIVESPLLSNAEKLQYIEHSPYTRKEQEKIIRAMIEEEYIHPNDIHYYSGASALQNSTDAARWKFVKYLISKGATH